MFSPVSCASNVDFKTKIQNIKLHGLAAGLKRNIRLVKQSCVSQAAQPKPAESGPTDPQPYGNKCLPLYVTESFLVVYSAATGN